jgi:hypothetical protein
MKVTDLRLKGFLPKSKIRLQLIGEIKMKHTPLGSNSPIKEKLGGGI